MEAPVQWFPKYYEIPSFRIKQTFGKTFNMDDIYTPEILYSTAVLSSI